MNHRSSGAASYSGGPKGIARVSVDRLAVRTRLPMVSCAADEEGAVRVIHHPTVTAKELLAVVGRIPVKAHGTVDG